MNVRPIKTQADYKWALREIEQYFDDEPVVGSTAGNRFDVLATLIEAYENRHHPIDAPDPIALIKAHMTSTGKTQTDLAKLLGSRPRASEVLKRQRALTKQMVQRLNEKWHLPADALIAPYKIKRPPTQSRMKRQRHPT